MTHDHYSMPHESKNQYLKERRMPNDWKWDNMTWQGLVWQNYIVRKQHDTNADANIISPFEQL